MRVEMTCVWKRSLVVGVLAVLACVLAGARANAQGDDLVRAAFGGDLPRVKALLAAGSDVNAKDGDGGTALMMASQKGRQEVVRALLEAKADVNARAGNGTTALILALKKGHQEIVQLLKSAGATDRQARREVDMAAERILAPKPAGNGVLRMQSSALWGIALEMSPPRNQRRCPRILPYAAA